MSRTVIANSRTIPITAPSLECMLLPTGSMWNAPVRPHKMLISTATGDSAPEVGSVLSALTGRHLDEDPDASDRSKTSRTAAIRTLREEWDEKSHQIPSVPNR
jgi:hypothetical protein